jgi:predicted amidohydrolase
MIPSRSVATAQTVPVPGHVDANVQEHLELIGLAHNEGAQVLLFPELSLTGYELDRADALAFASDDARLAPLADAAVGASLTLIVGAPVRIASRLHIGAFIIAPDRTIEVYTKHHLGAFSERARVDSLNGTIPPAEATIFDPGTSNPLVRVGGHLGAIAICADIGRPLHVQAAAARGVRLYLAGMFVIPSELGAETAALAGYAREHSLVVGFANYGGSSGGLAAGGRSAIWSSTGDLLVQLGSAGSGVAVATEIGSGWRARTVIRQRGSMAAASRARYATRSPKFAKRVSDV